MATIEMSAGWFSGLGGRLAQKGVYVTPSMQIQVGMNENQFNERRSKFGFLITDTSNAYSSDYACSYLLIMKGAIPSDVNATIASNSRNSDILIQFSNHGAYLGGLWHLQPSDVVSNPIIIKTTYWAAQQSGLATWFWLAIMPNIGATGGPAGGPALNSIIGTVGVNGSGADLEIPTTNIIANELYRVTNLRFYLPSSWTY